MKKFLIKIIIFIVIGVFAGGGAFYFWKSKYAIPANAEIKTARLEEKNKEKLPGNEVKIEEKIKKEAAANEAEIINYIENNISRLVSRGPALSANWQAVKIWFIDSKNFYVDYKSGANGLKRILITQLSGGAAASYEVLGHFVPGERGWILESGKDLPSDKPLRVYEKNEQGDVWVIK